MAELKKLDTQDEAVIMNAIRLSKANFVELYSELGYNKIFVGLNWHSIRTSSRGQQLFEQLYPQGRDRSQPLTFISDIKAEAELIRQGVNDSPALTETNTNVNMATEKKKSVKKVSESKLQPEHPIDKAAEAPTSELVGKKVAFTKKGDETKYFGKVLKTFVANDDKEYAKIRLDDYSTCLKQTVALTVVPE